MDPADLQAQPRPDPARATREAASIGKATEADRSEVVTALAQAFYDDPVLGWFLPDDARRMRQLESLFGYFGEKVWFALDETYTTAMAAGAAVWMPPDTWRVGVWDQVRMLPGMASAIGLRGIPRLLRGFNLMESKHPHDRHYYLPLIGVRPEWQGRGLGTALLLPVLERCDRDKMPAYLEATTPRNLACYQRNGFEVTQEFVLPDGPPMWPTWREPRRRV
jgi:GNAT superfamily N-acetyltransferase